MDEDDDVPTLLPSGITREDAKFLFGLSKLLNSGRPDTRVASISKIVIDEADISKQNVLIAAARAKKDETVNAIISDLFLGAIKKGDEETVKKILNSSRDECGRCAQIFYSVKPIYKRFTLSILAFDALRIFGGCIGISDWLEALYLTTQCNPGYDRRAEMNRLHQMKTILLKTENCVGYVTRNGWTVLHLAMFQCQQPFETIQLEKVKILLNSRRIDVNALTDESETVLHFACRYLVFDGRNYRDVKMIIRGLLSLNVNVNQRNDYGQTALMVACINGCQAAVHVLLKRKDDGGNIFNVDLIAKDKHGQDALSLAKQSERAKIVAMIEQALFLNAVENGDIKTARIYLGLSNEAHYNDQSEETVEYQSPVDNSISYSVWWKALLIACSKPHDDILQLLLNDDRFNLGVKENGHTVLHLAVEEFVANACFQKAFGRERKGFKILQKIKILLKSCRCDVNALNSKQETAVHLICNMLSSRSDHYPRFCDFLTVILQSGIDLNSRDRDGKTAFMIACENELDDIIRLILEEKKQGKIHLDFNVVDNFGETALRIARRKGCSKLVDELQEAMLLAAVDNENVDAVKSLLDEAGNNDESFVNLWRVTLYRKEMAKKWSWKPIYPLPYLTWKEAVDIAIGKSNEDVLKILLNYEPIIRSQLTYGGDTILHKIFCDTPEFTRMHLRSVEILLDSDKISVNAIEHYSARTPLHRLCGVCAESRESPFCIREDHDVINEIVLSLLRHNANVNQKDEEGTTPLMIASATGCNSIIRTILTWARETGSWLDLDARDFHGLTALMTAATWKHADVVEALLDAGASVNVSNNHGFTALHHALNETISPNLWINFGDLPRNVEELKNRKERNVILFQPEEPHQVYKRDRGKLNDDKMNVVALLLKRSDINVNALAYEGYSPLDIVEASIPDIPSSIKDALKEKGAKLNVFEPLNQRTTCNSERREELLHRFAYGVESCMRYHEDSDMTDDAVWFKLINKMDMFDYVIIRQFSQLSTTVRDQLVSAKDQRGRTPLHCAIINLQDKDNYLRPICDESCSASRKDISDIVKMLISFGCSVNATDIYGRTPMHYAYKKKDWRYDREVNLWSLLASLGADPTIKDKDGISVIEMGATFQCRHKKLNPYLTNPAISLVEDILRRICNTDQPHIRSDLIEEKINSLHTGTRIHWCEHLNPKTIPERLWKVGVYAFRQPTVNEITTEVTDFVNDLAFEIKRRDPRFEVRPLLIGSSYEGTKIDLPDEFNFDLVLTRISELCEVCPSPELPTGFVQLKGKQSKSNIIQETEFESFFSENGMLMTQKINAQFKMMLTNLLTDPQFIQSHAQNFDWDCHCLRKGGLESPYDTTELATTLKLSKTKWNLNIKSSFEEISVKIVPCIHIDGWWPDGAISNVGDDIKALGCNLVFDRPQRLYPWVPYSESCARISFAPAESEMIKRSPDEAKQAYMIGKQLMMAKRQALRRYDNPYVLKTSFLYCIEAFTSICEMASEFGLTQGELKHSFNPKDIHIWMETLMKCYLDFFLQDFCPCYFMPNFCLPIIGHLKSNHIYNLADDHDFNHLYFLLYYITLLHPTDFSFQLPSFNPVFEKFDRKVMIASLSKSASEKIGKQLDDYTDNGSGYCDSFCSSCLKSLSDN